MLNANLEHLVKVSRDGDSFSTLTSSVLYCFSICYYFVGLKSGRSLLIEDGALPWIVQNANNEAAPIRRHIELALCHLAQHGISVIENIQMLEFVLIGYGMCRKI